MKILNHPLFIVCLLTKYLLAISIFGEPFAALHDNLDSEVVYSTVKGRFWALGFDTSVFDVFLGGVLEWYYFDRIFSPLTVLYAIFQPHWAYFLTEFFSLCLAYIGMVLLLARLFDSQKKIKLLSAAFAFSISFSSFGFGLHATPMVLATLIDPRRMTFMTGIGIFLLGTLSSFILHGLFLPVATISFLWIFRQRPPIAKICWILGLFVAGTIIASSSIFIALLQGIVFHRSDWQTEPALFDLTALLLSTMSNLLILGSWYHAHIVPALVALFCLFCGTVSGHLRIRRTTLLITLFIVVCSLIGDLKLHYVSILPETLAGLQFNRIGFYAGLFVIVLASQILVHSKRLWVKHFTSFGATVYLIICLMAGSGFSINNLKTAFNETQKGLILSTIKSHGIESAFSRDHLGSNALSWKIFKRTESGFSKHFRPHTYRCIAKHVNGKRTFSFGLDPMVAAFHGVKVIDGYHNLYPKTYKDAFGEVIAAQLQHSSKGPGYYHDWGNRVYSFVQPLAKIMINFDAAKGLGAQIVISDFALHHRRLKEIPNQCSPKNTLYLYQITTL